MSYCHLNSSFVWSFRLRLNLLFLSSLLFIQHIKLIETEQTRGVIVKLLLFTMAMITLPIGSYFLTVNTIFKGMLCTVLIHATQIPISYLSHRSNIDIAKNKRQATQPLPELRQRFWLTWSSLDTWSLLTRKTSPIVQPKKSDRRKGNKNVSQSVAVQYLNWDEGLLSFSRVVWGALGDQ